MQITHRHSRRWDETTREAKAPNTPLDDETWTKADKAALALAIRIYLKIDSRERRDLRRVFVQEGGSDARCGC